MSDYRLTFTRGPEVPPPGGHGPPGRPSSGWAAMEWRRAWRRDIDQAVRDEDAWGLLCTAPDCDVTLRDVLTPGAVWAATGAHSVHLLLAREAP